MREFIEVLDNNSEKKLNGEYLIRIDTIKAICFYKSILSIIVVGEDEESFHYTCNDKEEFCIMKEKYKAALGSIVEAEEMKEDKKITKVNEEIWNILKGCRV